MLMTKYCSPKTFRRQHGLTMLEVLITIIIVSLGLLGLAGLQARVQVAELEAYQRTQATVLLQEMVDRINANRKNASAYIAEVGTGNTTEPTNPADCAGLSTLVARDRCYWHHALLGAAESRGSGGANLGAMIGARGCISNAPNSEPAIFTTQHEFMVAVAWQGITPTTAPTTTACGSGAYGNEATRRAIVTRVMIGCLQNNPAAGSACCTINPGTGICEVPSP